MIIFGTHKWNEIQGFILQKGSGVWIKSLNLWVMHRLLYCNSTISRERNNIACELISTYCDHLLI